MLLCYIVTFFITLFSSIRCQDWNKRRMRKEYDFIVVGGGSGGSVVASRLSENPDIQVLLLEAGGDENVTNFAPGLLSTLLLTDQDWQYRTVPQKNTCLGLKNNECPWPRGKVLGGTSSINSMIYNRGHNRDYDRWASLGNYGWNWDQVLPYFLKSEDNNIAWLASDNDHHHFGGPLKVSEVYYRSRLLIPFLRAATLIGYPVRDLNGANFVGSTPLTTTTYEGSRVSAATAFLRPVANRPNLHVLLNSMVLKVLFNNTKHAESVIYERRGKKYTVKASKEVILAAGAINTPQLLMLSGIGPAEHLQDHRISVVQDLPGVGSNLQDHVQSYSLVWITNRSLFSPEGDTDTDDFNQWQRYRTGPLSSPLGVEAIVNFKTSLKNMTDDYVEINLTFSAGSVLSDNGTIFRQTLGYTDETWNTYFAPFINYTSVTMVPTLLRPKSRGTIRLRTSNPYDHPIIDPNYLSDHEDMRVLIEEKDSKIQIIDGQIHAEALKRENFILHYSPANCSLIIAVKTAVILGSTSFFQDNDLRFIPSITPGCENVVAYTDAYWECLIRHHAISGAHQVGTAKMGPQNDSMAVVDPELRVYGVRGLRVIDGSIMPLVVSGNTNAPIIMIGEKGSDLIKKTWNL